MNFEVQGVEFPTENEAIQHTCASGRGHAIRISGKNMVIEKAEADRIAALGACFAYLTLLDLPDGSTRIVTVPVN
ncbi:MAG: hypothetical protein KF678_10935 [Phycisphaeraceae bacterium]|nr:hypothetical protein [Phycisphaeraceae bacterium]